MLAGIRGLRSISCGLLFIFLMASQSVAQSPAPDILPISTLMEWEAQIEAAQRLLDRDNVGAEELDVQRAELTEQRSQSQRVISELTSEIEKIRLQIETLGPPPGEGLGEAEEVANRRADLGSIMHEMQVQNLAAQSVSDDAGRIIASIGARVRAQFSSRLIALGPSPLNPALWPEAARDIGRYVIALGDEVNSRLDNRFSGKRIKDRLPFAGLLFAIGLVVMFGVRTRHVRLMEDRVRQVQTPGTSAWLGALLNLARLVVPTVGAGFLIAGIRTLGLFGPIGQTIVVALPVFAGAIILAYWIGHSLFAPILTRFRLIKLEDGAAKRGAALTMALGLSVGLNYLLQQVLNQQDALPETRAVLSFPLIVIVAFAMWRLAVLVRSALSRKKVEDPVDVTPVSEPFGLNIARILRRSALVIAIVSVMLGAVGYVAAAQYLLFSSVRTFALLSGAFVLFVVVMRAFEGFIAREISSSEPTSPGLMPVFVGLIISLICLPFLALVWGAQRSNLWEAWIWLRDGFSVGDIRISLTDFLFFLLIFGAGYLLTRFLQSILRSTVLPRTKLDIGGQNALTTGLGYIGIFLSALIAITFTGLDLSSLAIVAGALSVGVGFGLQTIVSNFVSGIILLVERPIKQGDWIEVAGFSGYVSKISVRSTSIETFDRATVIVPNQELIAGSVLNWTHGSLSGRVIVPIGVAYGSDARKVADILLEIAKAHPLVLRRPAPAVLFRGFGADSMDFEIRAHLRDVNYMLSAKSDMNFAIAERFAEEGIEIPFAQRDINLRNVNEIAEAFGRPAAET